MYTYKKKNQHMGNKQMARQYVNTARYTHEHPDLHLYRNKTHVPITYYGREKISTNMYICVRDTSLNIKSGQLIYMLSILKGISLCHRSVPGDIY